MVKAPGDTVARACCSLAMTGMVQPPCQQGEMLMSGPATNGASPERPHAKNLPGVHAARRQQPGARLGLPMNDELVARSVAG
jgi:hypothetical protein